VDDRRRSFGQTTDRLLDAPEPELYFPWAQFPYPRYSGWVVVRADRPLALVPDIRERLRAIDPTVPMVKVGTMEARLADVAGPQRFRATLASALGLATIALTTTVSTAFSPAASRVKRANLASGSRSASPPIESAGGSW